MTPIRMFRPALVLLVLSLLAGCDSPSPVSPFAGVAARQVEVGGSTFSVRVAGSRARAVRTDFDLRAGSRGGAIVPRAGIAMEQVSGCLVLPGSLRGDAAVSEARLAC